MEGSHSPLPQAENPPPSPPQRSCPRPTWDTHSVGAGSAWDRVFLAPVSVLRWSGVLSGMVWVFWGSPEAGCRQVSWREQNVSCSIRAHRMDAIFGQVARHRCSLEVYIKDL